MKFVKSLSLLACLFVGPALAGSTLNTDNWLEARLAGERVVLTPRVNASAIIQFASSALASAPSAYFSADNPLYTGAVNNVLKTNGTQVAGPFLLPSTTTNPWFIYVEGVTNNAASWLNSNPEYALAHCTASACGSASDRGLWTETPGQGLSGKTTAFQFYLSAKYTSNQWWGAQAVTATTLTVGSGYPNGTYAWTADSGSGSCQVPPSGLLQVGTAISGRFDYIHVTNPGKNCLTAPTVTINATNFPAFTTCIGASTCSGGAITLAIGPATGIMTKPGQHWCGIIGQYSATSKFVHFVDSTGAKLLNAPTVDTVSASGFLAASQSTLGDFFNTIGSSFTGTGVSQYGWGGQLANVGMVWGAYPNTVTAGTPDDAPLQALCTKTQDIKTWALAQGYTLRSLYRLNDAGTWADSSTSNSGGPWTSAGVVGTVKAGAPITPGAALTVTDPGAYTVYPVVNISAGYGSVLVSGTYNATTLGGTPSSIQAQISATPNGSPLSGCTPSCAWQTITASPSGGIYSGSIPGVPATTSGPYYVSVRAANAPTYVATGGPVQVGVTCAWTGQSQMAVFWAANTGTATTPASMGSATHIGISTLDLLSTSAQESAPGVSFGGFPWGYSASRVVAASGFNTASGVGTYNVVGDGIATFFSKLSTAFNGWPVSCVNLTRVGNPIDAWANGYVTQTQNLAGTGTPTLSATLGFAESSLGLSQPSTSTVSFPSGGNYILAGSLKILSNGVQIASDATSVVIGTGLVSCSTTTSCVSVCPGSNGYTVSACSINYITGVSSITFTGNVSGTVQATWLNIVSNIPLASLYDGDDLTGNGLASSGQTSNIMAQVPAPFNLHIHEQCTANESEFGAFAGGAVSMTAKTGYVFGSKFPALFPWAWSASTPMMAVGYPRDVSIGGSVDLSGCQQWTHDFGTASSFNGTINNGTSGVAGTTLTLNSAASGPMWIGEYLSNTATGTYIKKLLTGSLGASGSTYQVSVSQSVGPIAMANPYVYAYGSPSFGGSAWDDAVLLQNTGADNPHPTTGNFGGSRLARRMAATAWAAITGNTSVTSEPYISSVAFSTVTGGNHSSTCSTTGTCIDVTFTLNGNATQLLTCGTNLSNSTQPPSGSCTATGYASTPHVEGFRIGNATTQWHEDGFDPVGETWAAAPAGSVTSGQAFSCTLIAANIVECVAVVPGAWTPGSTVLSYADPSVFARAYTAAGVGSGALGNPMAVNAAGTTGLAAFSISGGTITGANGTYVATLAGGTCTHPSYKIVIAAGAISSSYPYSPGIGCSVAQTLTGATWSGQSTTNPFSVLPTANFPQASFPTDNNMMGEGLYDDSARSGAPAYGGAVTGFLYNLFNPYEPGLPVTPYNVLATGAPF